MNQLDDASIDRCLCANRVGEANDFAVQTIDLRLASAHEVFPHRRARFRIDRELRTRDDANERRRKEMATESRSTSARPPRPSKFFSTTSPAAFGLRLGVVKGSGTTMAATSGVVHVDNVLVDTQ